MGPESIEIGLKSRFLENYCKKSRKSQISRELRVSQNHRGFISVSKFSSLKIFSNKFHLIFHDQTQANWTINHFHFTQSTKSVHRKKISWKIKKFSVSKTTHSYLIRLINDFP